MPSSCCSSAPHSRRMSGSSRHDRRRCAHPLCARRIRADLLSRGRRRPAAGAAARHRIGRRFVLESARGVVRAISGGGVGCPGLWRLDSVGAEHPAASNYAAALDDWLDALGIARCHLLGHSLGSLIAARFAAEHPERVITLTLAGVARGHGHLPPPQRERLLRQRLDDLAELGPHGMAAKRGPRLLGPEATEAIRRTVVETMAHIHPGGYAQAARMLSTGDIMADLAELPAGLPIQVIVGDADLITPPADCLEIAAACRAAATQVIPGAGHALYPEKPREFNRLLADFTTANGLN